MFRVMSLVVWGGVFCAGSAMAAEQNAFLPIREISPGVLSSPQPCAARSEPTPQITAGEADALFHAYQISGAQRKNYTVEFIVPPDLGGDATLLANYWPHLMRGPWNHGDKIKVDRKLAELVCAQKLELVTAQHALMSDWTEAYEKYVGAYPPPPAAR